MRVTFALSLVSLGHDFPGSAFRKQHNTDLSVRLCLDSCISEGETGEGFLTMKCRVQPELSAQVKNLL